MKHAYKIILQSVYAYFRMLSSQKGRTSRHSRIPIDGETITQEIVAECIEKGKEWFVFFRPQKLSVKTLDFFIAFFILSYSGLLTALPKDSSIFKTPQT
jgi:hypothetical protein